MASRQPLQVGIRIGAKDDASAVISGMVNRANSSMKGLAAGLAAYGAGSMMKNVFGNITDKYSDQEYSLASLRIMEMNKLGKVNEQVYGDEEAFIKGLSNKYAKSVEEYTNMVVLLRQNRLTPQDILGGIGETTAHLGKVFDNMEPRTAALFFARLKNDMRVSSKEMDHLANMAFKLKNIGVGGGDANMTIHELTEAYGKAGLGAVNLGLGGARDAEDLGVLMGTFIAKGITGQTTGNNFRRIFDGLRDPERVGKVTARAAQYGVHVSFYDGQGRFKGIRHFEHELKRIGKLSIQQRAEVLKPFSGKQGLSTDFLEYLAKFGKDVEEIRGQYEGITDLDSALNEVMKTQRIINAQTESAKENMSAAFGKSVSGDVKKYNEVLRSVYITITDIVGNHPELTKVTLEIAGAAGALGSVIGGFKALSMLNPIFGKIAAGITSAFAPVMSVLAALEILNYSYSSADSKAAKAGGKYAENNAFFNERIEANKEEDAMIATNFWRFKKAAHSLSRSLFGKTYYEGDLVNNERKDYNQSIGDYWAEKFPGLFGPSKSGTWLGMSSLAKTQGYGGQINYAPTINSSLSQDTVNQILKNHTDTLMRALENEQRRQANMSYGSTAH